MLYSDIRDKMQSGDLLAWRSRTLAGKFIRAVTGYEYSHVGIVWRKASEDGVDRVFIIEAREWRGVVIRPASKALPFSWLSVGIWNQDVEDYLFRKLGNRYDWRSMIRAGLRRKAVVDNAYQCAEFAAMAYIKANVIHRLPQPTPGEIVSLMENVTKSDIIHLTG